MQQNVTLPKPWPDFLKAVDAELSREVSLHCIGGFVLAALYQIPRPTGDVDYIASHDAQEIERVAGQESALAKKFKLFFQGVGVAEFPYEYESRLMKLDLGLDKLQLWVMDPYDLLLTKMTRNNPKDREDAKFLIKKLDLEFASFENRFLDEMAGWIPNPDRHALTVKLWHEYFPKAKDEQVTAP